MWTGPGLVILVITLTSKVSTAQDSRLDSSFTEGENAAAGLEVMQQNPCPKGCLPEKRARSISGGGPLLDVLSRRSALDKNFMRFGRTPPETTVPHDENVYRASRAKNTNFIRLGRGKSDNFMRFGRRDDFMRFGRRDDFLRFGRRDDFMRFGRAGGKVVRLGPANGTSFRDDFVRFGRNTDTDVADEDGTDDAALGTPQVQESDDEDRRWKRNVVV